MSSGIAIASAIIFGSTSRSVCGMPMTASASSSSVTRMTPICAVIAEPERPATRIAASTGPSSRMIAMPSRLTMKMSAPKLRSCCAER